MQAADAPAPPAPAAPPQREAFMQAVKVPDEWVDPVLQELHDRPWIAAMHLKTAKENILRTKGALLGLSAGFLALVLGFLVSLLAPLFAWPVAAGVIVVGYAVALVQNVRYRIEEAKQQVIAYEPMPKDGSPQPTPHIFDILLANRKRPFG